MKIRAAAIIIFLFFIPVFISGQIHTFENQIRLAKTFESNGQLDLAEEIYTELYNTYPANYQFYSYLFNNYLAQKKYDEASELVEKQLKLNPKSVNLYGDKGSLLYLSGQEDEAIKIWEEALNIEPENPFAYRAIADFLIQNRLLEKAIEVLKIGNSVSKDPTIFSYDIANFYSITMKYEEAAEEYCRILERKPKQMNMVKNKILGYINSPQAEGPTLATIEKYYRSKSDLIYLELLSGLYIRTNNASKALEAVRIIEEETTRNGSSIFAFAQQAVLNNDFKIASEAYLEIIEDYPASALYSQAEIGYARSLENIVNSASETDTWKPINFKGQIDTAKYIDLIKAYSNLSEKYVNSEIGWEAEIRMADIYNKKLDKIEKADTIYRKILNERRSLQFLDDANYGLAEIAVKKGSLETAIEYLEAVLDSRLADNTLILRSNFLLAKCNMWKGEFEQSKKFFTKLTENPKSDYANDALQYLLIINTFQNDSLNLFSFTNSDYLLELNEIEKALEGFGRIADNTGLFILKDIAALRYAELLIAMNNYEEAGIFLEKQTNCDESNIYKDRFLYLLGMNYYFGLKNPEKALDPLNKILSEYNNSIYSGKARKLISQINPGVGSSI